MKTFLPSCSSLESYFNESLNFFEKYEWLFNFRLTDVLIENIFDKVPEDWHTALQESCPEELKLISGEISKDTWPSSLVQFLNQCNKLNILPRNCFNMEEKVKLPQAMLKGMSPKKKHEVLRLVQVVHEECSLKGITNILDLGSGLGYLGRILHYKYGYIILGLETDKNLIEKSLKLQNMYCSSHVKYLHCNISDFAYEEIKSAISNYFSSNYACLECDSSKDKICTHQSDITDEMEALKHNNTDAESLPPICMVGLHMCGDLSAVAINLFHKLSAVKLLINIPCCYHKMSDNKCNPADPFHSGSCIKKPGHEIPQGFENINFNHRKKVQEVFRYFPMSTLLKEKISPVHQSFLQRPFLRLACQEVTNTFLKRDSILSSLMLLTPALLYSFAYQEGIILQKKQRRSVRPSNATSFHSALAKIVDNYDFIKSDNSSIIEKDEVKAHIEKMWIDISKLQTKANSLLYLHLSMQATLESFILTDRLLALQEAGHSTYSCSYVKVMDSDMSPRCYALVAQK